MLAALISAAMEGNPRWLVCVPGLSALCSAVTERKQDCLDRSGLKPLSGAGSHLPCHQHTADTS